ncbi:MAG: hypothetical protein H6830_11845 [Planctomycetes bacterium]|nr:hypothetical protein [Planctomycetota bacterium]MCB9908869.1 hypothetical protein [Planctomycetota bacterium]HPF14130.1 tetratricopeptide repeat protein [Planctomycetota bacterium]HRV80586.1 tetratricopeptide repeat protein [Planctomycetota bacterium]
MTETSRSNSLLALSGLALLGGALGGALVSQWNHSRTAADDPAPATLEPESSQPWREPMADLESRIQELQREVQALAEAPRVALQAGPDATQEVARASSGAQDTPPVEATPESQQAQLDDWLARLVSGELDNTETADLWEAAKLAGRADELLALFEARAAADPQNPDLQTDLGQAYLQRLQQYGANSNKTGLLAMKADQSFDRALKLDEGHLEARRSKAIALSFWPPVTGKQAEAIHQFEVLIEKQNAHPLAPEHQVAYLLLGNMHMQMGDLDKARAVWNQGLERFPGDPKLLAQLQATAE